MFLSALSYVYLTQEQQGREQKNLLYLLFGLDTGSDGKIITDNQLSFVIAVFIAKAFDHPLKISNFWKEDDYLSLFPVTWLTI